MTRGRVTRREPASAELDEIDCGALRGPGSARLMRGAGGNTDCVRSHCRPMAGSKDEMMETDAPTVGQPTPPLDLPRLEGGRFDLTTLRGGAVLVSFLRHAG